MSVFVARSALTRPLSLGNETVLDLRSVAEGVALEQSVVVENISCWCIISFQ